MSREIRRQERTADVMRRRQVKVTKNTDVSAGDGAHRTFVQSRYMRSRNSGTHQQNAPSRRAAMRRETSPEKMR